MKNLRLFACLFLLGFLFTTLKAQEANDGSLGLPGDNLNLYAVLKLFQESETLEGFEKNLNDKNLQINNLDLDGDENIDYIKVQDNVDGDVHTIVLQIAVTPHENQDVAVITVQRFANNQVQMQLIGDEELYGKNYIIEPNYDTDGVAGETPNPGYTGNAQPVNGQTFVVNRTTYFEVAAWPVVRFIYMPSYVVWYSPWYYGYYPPYWQPWRPHYWHYYYGYHHNYNNYYYGHFRRSNHYRYDHWNDGYYNSRRSHSEVVYQRRQAGSYKNTYSRPDSRKEGTELYRQMHPKNATRAGNKPTTRSGVSKPVTRSEITKPNTRPDVNKQVARPAINKPTPRPDVNKPTGKTSVNKPSTRHSVNKPATKPDNNKNTRPEKPGKQPNTNKRGK